MQQTETYKLNLIETSDTFSPEALNKNAQMLETALARVDAAIAKLGSCAVVCGTYKGTGGFGERNPNTLTFDHKPVAVFLQDGQIISRASRISSAYYYPHHPTWGEKSVSWYNVNDDYQLNIKNTVYSYVALLEVGG